MDPLSARGTEGQALVFAALLLGVAAFVAIGLRGASDRLLSGVLEARAGEAAVAAAGSAVADLALARARSLGREMDAAETAAFAAEDGVVGAARDAASSLARLHGRADPSDVSVHSFGVEIELHLTLGGRRHVALLVPPP